MLHACASPLAVAAPPALVDAATLADAVVVLHLAFLLFVVLGELAVLVGGALGWRWVRRRRLRLAHLVCAWIPGLEALVGAVCPLTRWERALRERAGQERDELGFVARLVRELLFYDVPPWLLGALHVAFALLVSASWRWVRPRARYPKNR